MTDLVLNIDEVSFDGGASIVQDLFANWSLPSIQSFTGGDALPLSAWGHTLTYFDLFLDIDNADDGLHLLPLLSALHSTPLIETLKVITTCEAVVPIGAIEYPVVTLDRLRSIELTLFDIETPRWFSFLFYTLHTPNLQSLSLMLDLAPCTSARDWILDLNTLPNFPRSCLSPETVALTITNCHHDHIEPRLIGGDDVVTAALWMFPSSRLHEISIRDPWLRFDRSLQRFLPASHLRVLKFVDCEMLSAHAVHGWIQRMRKASEGQIWGAFEKLELVRCKQFSENGDVVEKIRAELVDRLEIKIV